MYNRGNPEYNLHMLNSARTLLLDPAYRKLLLKTRSWKTVIRAGFIPEPLLNKSKLADDWFMKDRDKYNGKKGCILVMTGCFAPMHYGHIEALTMAKKAIEKRLELPVLGGYLSLCHGDYVLEKTGNQELASINRAYEMATILANRAPWIQPSTWEAAQSGALNFTTVYRQFVELFPKHRIVYVYGSDNEAFRLAFLNNELNVCIRRAKRLPGPTEVAPQLKTNTLYLSGGEWRAMSSTIIRENQKTSGLSRPSRMKVNHTL